MVTACNKYFITHVAQTADAYFAKHRNRHKLKISTNDLPRTHKMISNHTAI